MAENVISEGLIATSNQDGYVLDIKADSTTTQLGNQ